MSEEWDTKFVEKPRDRFDELARDMIDLDASSGDQGTIVFTEMGKEPVEVTSGDWTHMCEVAAKIETLLANAMRKADAEKHSQVQLLRATLTWIGDPKRETEAKHSVMLSGPFGPARTIREMQVRARAALIETADTLPPEKIEKPSEKVPF